MKTSIIDYCTNDKAVAAALAATAALTIPAVATAHAKPHPISEYGQVSHQAPHPISEYRLSKHRPAL